MQLSIRTKFLTLGIALVLLGGISLSIPYYILTTRQTRRQSQERIQIAFEIIVNDFTKRVATYTARFQEFLAQNTTLQWALYSYDQHQRTDDAEWAMIRFLFQSYDDLSSEITTFGRVALADRVMLYGADRQLVMAYHRQDGGEYPGSSLASESEGHLYLPMDDIAVRAEITFRGNNADLRFKSRLLPRSPTPDGMALRYAGAIPATVMVTIFRQDTQLGVRIAAPIMRRDQALGVLVGDMLYTQEMAAEYAALSKTEVNFFAGPRLSVGTLSEYAEMSAADSRNFPDCEMIRASADAMAIRPWRINHQVYDQAGCSLKANGQTIGSVVVNLSQALERPGARHSGSRHSRCA